MFVSVVTQKWLPNCLPHGNGEVPCFCPLRLHFFVKKIQAGSHASESCILGTCDVSFCDGVDACLQWGRLRNHSEHFEAQRPRHRSVSCEAAVHGEWRRLVTTT